MMSCSVNSTLNISIDNANQLFKNSRNLLKKKCIETKKNNPFSLQCLSMFTILECTHRNKGEVQIYDIYNCKYVNQMYRLKLLEPWYGDYNRIVKLPLPLKIKKVLLKMRMLLNNLFLTYDMYMFGMPKFTLKYLKQEYFYIKPQISIFHIGTVILAYRSRRGFYWCQLTVDTCKYCRALGREEVEIKIRRGNYCGSFFTCEPCRDHFRVTIEKATRSIEDVNVDECFTNCINIWKVPETIPFSNIHDFLENL